MKNSILKVETFLLVLLLNSQIIKVFTVQSVLVNIIPILILISFPIIMGILFIYKKRYDIYKKNIILLSLICIFFINVTLYLVIGGFSNIVNYVSFIMILLLGINSYFLNEKQIEDLTDLTININYIYVILLFLSGNLGRVIGNFTYLNMNISIGLALVLAVRKIFISFQMSLVLKIVILGIGILSYNSRGPLYPIFLMLIIEVLRKFKEKPFSKDIIVILGFLALVVVKLKGYFLKNPHILNRLLRAFKDIKSEPRYELYSTYFNNLSRDWFTGAGIGKSGYFYNNSPNFYPHNLILQVWGEYGFIGMLAITFIIINVIIRGYKASRKNQYIYSPILWGFYYYLFQFMKSFDMYSSYPVWILGGMLLCDERKGKNEDREEE